MLNWEDTYTHTPIYAYVSERCLEMLSFIFQNDALQWNSLKNILAAGGDEGDSGGDGTMWTEQGGKQPQTCLHASKTKHQGLFWTTPKQAFRKFALQCRQA